MPIPVCSCSIFKNANFKYLNLLWDDGNTEQIKYKIDP